MSDLKQSTRLSGLDSSIIIQMRRECERVNGINLASGTCELPIPLELQLAGGAVIRSGRNAYSLSEGVSDLRRAIAGKLARDNQIIADPDTEVAVTVGATGAYAATIMALLEPGDELLLLEPFYGWHRDTARMAGIIPRAVPLAPPGFRIDERSLLAGITASTRAIVLCTPGNPTGRVYSEEELVIVAKVAEEHQLLVIADEVYEYLVYDGRRHVSPRSLTRLADRTVSIMGFSKTFNITGWRLGYVVARPALVRSISLAHELLATCAPTPLQHAALAALALPVSYYQELRRTHQRRRDQLVSALAASGLEPSTPEGAFYVIAGFSKLGIESPAAAAHEILRRAHVACVPGSVFSDCGSDRFLRFCFARADDELDEACRRLRAM